MKLSGLIVFVIMLAIFLPALFGAQIQVDHTSEETKNLTKEHATLMALADESIKQHEDAHRKATALAKNAEETLSVIKATVTVAGSTATALAGERDVEKTNVVMKETEIASLLSEKDRMSTEIAQKNATLTLQAGALPGPVTTPDVRRTPTPPSPQVSPQRTQAPVETPEWVAMLRTWAGSLAALLIVGLALSAGAVAALFLGRRATGGSAWPGHSQPSPRLPPGYPRNAQKGRV